LESANAYNEGASQGLPGAPIRAIFEEGQGAESDLRMKKPSEVKSQKPSLSTSTSTTSSIWSNAPNPSQSSSVSTTITSLPHLHVTHQLTHTFISFILED
jgi:hypothetical protein